MMEQSIRESEGSFTGLDGLCLFSKTWRPGGQDPRAILVIIHGAGEHIGRYPHLVEALVAAGYMAAGYDQRGHGRSEGQRGHINTWEEYRADLDRFLEHVRSSDPGRPVFVFGHSMGSLVALDYLQRRSADLAGAIISGTSIEPAEAAPLYLKIIAKALSLISPKFNIKMPISGDQLSRDPQVAQAYHDDPLVHWDRSVRWGAEGLKVIKDIKSRAGEIDLPVLFLHGENDRAVSSSGARFMYENIASTDKTLRIYPGCLHEPHNDIIHKEVISDILDWLEKHSSRP